MEFSKKYIPSLQYCFICLLISTAIVSCLAESCGSWCVCDDTDHVVCENADFDTIPVDWPSSVVSVTITNCSLTKLQKQAFKRYSNLEEIIIRRCEKLVTVEKQAFKNLHDLRLLIIEDNPRLADISKGAFSLISGNQRLKIHLLNNAFDVVKPGSFRQISLLRELWISGSKCLKLKQGSFAGLMQIDFFNLNNVCEIEPNTFKNATRIYRLNISNSMLTLTKKIFSSISHSNEVRLSHNQISLIGIDAFFGLDTVERLVLSSNKIGNISSHAFSSIVNIGDLIIEENEIQYIDPESLQSTAWRTKFRDNYIECNCPNQWIKYVKDAFILKHNFCGAEESFRTLANFVPRCDEKPKGSSTVSVSVIRVLLACLAIIFTVSFKNFLSGFVS